MESNSKVVQGKIISIKHSKDILTWSNYGLEKSYYQNLYQVEILILIKLYYIFFAKMPVHLSNFSSSDIYFID